LLEGLEAVELRLSEVKKDNEKFRIDSEYFKKEYFEIENIIKKHKFIKLRDTNCEIIHPAEIKRNFVSQKDGVLFFRTQNLRALKIDLSNQVFISKEDAKKLSKNEIKYSDILMTRTGANFGDCFIYHLNEKTISSSHVFIIRNYYFNQSFLAIFFNTKFGKTLINKGMYGGLQPEIAPYYLKNIPIPIFSNTFQSQIENLVKTAYEKLKESKKLYKEAESLLLEELDLKDFTPTNKNITIKNLSESFTLTGRLDSEYYQPKYDEIIEKIKSYNGGYDYIKNIITWKKGIEVGSEAYQENGISFLRVSDFSKFGIENISKKISNELYEELKDNFKVEIGDILFTKDGTIGLSYVVKENIEAVVSGAFLRLNFKEKYQSFSKETLSLIFSSFISKMQVEQLSGGAIIAHLKPSDFEKFIIPIIGKNIQTQIEQKIKESFKLKKESKNLLDLAVQAVEIAIEKGENKGMELIKGKI